MIVTVLKVQDLLKNYTMGGRGCLKKSNTGRMSSWIIGPYLTECHMQEAGVDWGRKTSQYNRESVSVQAKRWAHGVLPIAVIQVCRKGFRGSAKIAVTHRRLLAACRANLLPSDNVYCVPGTWASPELARGEKSERVASPLFLSLLAVLCKNSNPLSLTWVYKPWL